MFLYIYIENFYPNWILAVFNEEYSTHCVDGSYESFILRSLAIGNDLWDNKMGFIVRNRFSLGSSKTYYTMYAIGSRSSLTHYIKTLFYYI